MTVVKKLEWNEYNDEQGIPDRWDAEASSFGVFYSIEIQHDGYRAVFDHEAVGAVGLFDTLEAAKAAAQADYEARILSALEPSAARKELMKQIREGTARGFLNDGSQPEGNPDLDCPYCCGSGHKGDVHPSAARDLALEEAARWHELQATRYETEHANWSNSQLLADEHRGSANSLRALKSQPAPDHADAGNVEGDGWLPTHRHKRRGTHYSLIGIGKMQADNWQVSREGFDQSIDMEEVSIYRSVDDGSLWVRPREEFEDGRFETIPTPPSGEVA